MSKKKIVFLSDVTPGAKPVPETAIKRVLNVRMMVVRQRQRIERLRNLGCSTHSAVQILQELENSLATFDVSLRMTSSLRAKGNPKPYCRPNRLLGAQAGIRDAEQRTPTQLQAKHLLPLHSTRA
jgi:hypothetical protein